MRLTLGSLFDGIGGFPLAGSKYGIVPVWASEIEPFCIRVTEKRLPDMKHYGDIHALNGAELEPVDIITFGSPCQDLSVAGARAGLDGSRSTLFFEAVRIIKEMRCATNGRYPGWAVWENVPGALSSHDGEDFRRVIEGLLRIGEPEANVPLPEKGKWLGAGEVMADHCSVAWRILDASQGWGVAQRRRRIFAVLDLDGQRAGKVLFESEGVSGYTPPGKPTGEGTAGSAENGSGTSGRGGGDGKPVSPDADDSSPPSETIVYGINPELSRPGIAKNPYNGIYRAKVCRTLDTKGANPSCNQGGMVVMNASYYQCGEKTTPPLLARDWKDPPIVQAEPQYRLRRLTPAECCRLQGFPDGWCENIADPAPSEEEVELWTRIFAEWDGLQGRRRPRSADQVRNWLMNPDSDAEQYKAYGNSVAVPCVCFVLAGIAWSAAGDKDKTAGGGGGTEPQVDDEGDDES